MPPTPSEWGGRVSRKVLTQPLPTVGYWLSRRTTCNGDQGTDPGQRVRSVKNGYHNKEGSMQARHPILTQRGSRKKEQFVE